MNMNAVSVWTQHSGLRDSISMTGYTDSLTKLKVSVGGADVVEGTHEALDDQSNAHGIIDTKVLGNSMRLNERVSDLNTETQFSQVQLTSTKSMSLSLRFL